MKSLKKILSIFAAFMMVVGLTMTSASAAGATITINNAIAGATYTPYRLFDVTKATSEVNGTTVVNGYSYTATKTQKDAIEALGTSGNDQPFEFLGVNTEENSIFSVKIKNGWTDSQVTKFVIDHIDTFKDQSTELTGKTPTNNTVTFSEVDPGYYFIVASSDDKELNGKLTLVMMGTTDITIQDKNSNGFTKSSDQTSGFAGVGDYVKYTITGTLYEGLTKYEVKDTMDNLTYVHNDSNTPSKNLIVKYAGEQGETIAPSNYKVTDESDNGFTLNFTTTFLNTIHGPQNIEVVYYGQVTEEAVEENKATNEANLTYGNNSSTNTDHKKVDVYNYNLNVLKVDETDTAETKKGLPGAQFQLYKGSENNKTLVNLVRVKDADGNDTNTWRLAGAEDNAPFDNTVETDEHGNLTIKGLDTDETYWLRETKAPDGYNIATSDFAVNDSSIEKPNQLTVTQEIKNGKGAQLPSTGGMGTTMIYIAGAILMVGAAIIFVTNKRMKHE